MYEKEKVGEIEYPKVMNWNTLKKQTIVKP